MLANSSPSCLPRERRSRRHRRGPLKGYMVRYIGAKDNSLVKHVLRGDTFRKKFSRLRELGSLVSQSVRVIALTATATAAPRVAVIRSLELHNPLVISVCP